MLSPRGHRPIRPGSNRDPKSNIPLKSVLKYLAVFFALFIIMLLVIRILEMAGETQAQTELMTFAIPVLRVS